MKILFLSASARTGSFNSAVAKAAYELAAQQFPNIQHIFVEPKDMYLPLFNEDIEKDSGPPESAQKLKQLFKDATGIFVSTPEYNGSYPALFKNAVDWVSRKYTPEEPIADALKDKKYGLACATLSRRTSTPRVISKARELLTDLGGKVMDDDFTLNNAAENIQENLLPEQKAKLLEFVKGFVNFVKS